jgi:Flp pilus assembly pilin Flp
MNGPRQLTTREDGQDLLEYGLLASLIAIFALAAMRLLATQITDVFWGAIATKF